MAKTFKELFADIKAALTNNKDALAAIEQQEARYKDEPPAEPTPALPTSQQGDDKTTAELKQLVLKLSEDNKKLVEMLTERDKKEKEREEALLKQAQKELKEKIDKEMKAANDDGRIAPKNEELNKIFRAQFEKDFESTKKIVDSLTKTVTTKEGEGAKKDGDNDAQLMTGLGSSLKPEFARYVQSVPATNE
jgi:hypothetical protein